MRLLLRKLQAVCKERCRVPFYTLIKLLVQSIYDWIRNTIQQSNCRSLSYIHHILHILFLHSCRRNLFAVVLEKKDRHSFETVAHLLRHFSFFLWQSCNPILPYHLVQLDLILIYQSFLHILYLKWGRRVCKSLHGTCKRYFCSFLSNLDTYLDDLRLLSEILLPPPTITIMIYDISSPSPLPTAIPTHPCKRIAPNHSLSLISLRKILQIPREKTISSKIYCVRREHSLTRKNRNAPTNTASER